VTRLDRVVVVGASAAGITAADTLRREGYHGELAIIGDEPHPPYDRPPLSKQVLAGTWEPERVVLRTPAQLAALDAELMLGRTATGLDRAGHAVLLDGGERVPFDGLIIATGVRPRRLPTGHQLGGVHVLRTLDDALSLRAQLQKRPATVVVGAGFLGAEVAAAARGFGAEVTIVDPMPVPMFRQFGPRVGALVGQLHTDHGVVVRTGVGVDRLLGADGRITGVALADGSLLDADLVVVAVGATPAADWLASSGLPLNNGVECDACSRAAPGIYAAGDVASWYNPHFGTRMRLEHRMNATEQAMAAARNLLGASQPFAPIPYFWTDQYDTKIQAYGLLTADAETSLAYGDVEERTFVLLYRRGDRVAGALGWNCPRELRRYRAHVADRTPWSSRPAPVTIAAENPGSKFVKLS
jgi:NADPH-dependent 2,4-dienoyl-CoA reductase/sulfur reductase-like enzyme